MTWKEERDALIAQTMAFVQSVTGKPVDFAQFELPAVPTRTPVTPHQVATARAAPAATSLASTTEPAAPRGGNGHGENPVPAQIAEPATATAHPSAAPAASASSRPGPVLPERFTSIASQLELQRDMQTEIRTRVARFRAHQERFNRERQEYFSATLARLKASGAGTNVLPED